MENINLHDAVVKLFSIDWSTGILKINIEIWDEGEKVISLVAIDLEYLSLSRKFPWGESSSINTIKINKTENNISICEIEMQSGDIVKFEAKSISVA